MAALGRSNSKHMMMSTTAWKILLEEIKPADEEARVLTLLLAGNPVAIAGHEALVPLDKLLPALPKDLLHPLRRRDRVEQDKKALFRLLGKNWTLTRSDDVQESFSFVMGWVLVNDSKFLRYTLNPHVAETLERIKIAHDLDTLF